MTSPGQHDTHRNLHSARNHHSAPHAQRGSALFEGTVLGGFECSCHKLPNGKRLDLALATRHEEFAERDYARLRAFGITAARDGVSWVRAERAGRDFDFSGAAKISNAATAHGVFVIWDLMHFGWPDDVDPFQVDFPRKFARYAKAFARFLAEAGHEEPMLTPINEMSFLAWAGGDVRCMNPFEMARGVELKAQFVRATIEAMEAIWEVLPRARFLQPEPLINIVPSPDEPKTWRRVESENLLQFQAWDMLCGRVWPSLGGAPRYLDVLGVNFYPANQFMLDGTTIGRHHAWYEPFSSLLQRTWERYERPLIISETGAEGDERADWFAYMVGECLWALEAGTELHGVTLYPVVDHPGWVDERHCENGLWGYADENGERPLYAPLAEELRKNAPLLEAARARMLARAWSLPIPA